MEIRFVRVEGFDRSIVVERCFENSVCNKTLHVARVRSALLTQGLNEYLVCEWVCVCVCVCVCVRVRVRVANVGRARAAVFKRGLGACWRGQKNGTKKNVGKSQFETLLLELCSY